MRLVESVTFHCQRINNYLHQFFAFADKIDLEYAADSFELLLEVFGNTGQRPLRNVARKVQNQHRIFLGQLGFRDRRVVCFAGQFRRRVVDAFPDVLQSAVRINASFELDYHTGTAFIGFGDHLLDTLDGANLLFHRAYQESLRVLRGNPVMRHLNIDDRNFDIGLRLFRDSYVGVYPGHDNGNQPENDRTVTGHCDVDKLHR